MLLSGKPHFLVSWRSPSIDVNTSIPEDRPRGPCILVSSSSLMSSLDYLKGVLSSFMVGCVSHAQIKLHYHTIEIRTGYWFLHYLVEDLDCHLTLAHWWVYFWNPHSFMSLVIFGLHWGQCSKAPEQCFGIDSWLMQYIVPQRLWLSISKFP